MIREEVTASPLYWPTGWERTRRPQRSKFGNISLFQAVQELGWELDRLGANKRIVSTNLRLRQDGLPYSGQKIPNDPGVSVWFDMKGEERVLACDRWDRVEHNVRAITKHIDALRGQSRWGVGSLEQAFAGFTALPETAIGEGWRDILLIEPDEELTPAVVDQRFKARALKCHPDHGGSDADWHELAMARKQALEAIQ